METFELRSPGCYKDQPCLGAAGGNRVEGTAKARGRTELGYLGPVGTDMGLDFKSRRRCGGSAVVTTLRFSGFFAPGRPPTFIL